MRLIITLAILLYFPVFAHAGVFHSRSSYKRSAKHGEFSSPVGIFNSKLDLAANGQFRTQGVISRGSIFKNTYSRDLKSTHGVFSPSSDLSSSGPIFNSTRSEFSSAGTIFKEEVLASAKESFKGPHKGEFKFSLPK
ncbi:MAG TPA: hypothetical protein PL125_06620 [Candidatus Omnitrophota bacterium]|nr:hypothetical protein [Candidatus Omnitrophota bacterium]